MILQLKVLYRFTEYDRKIKSWQVDVEEEIV